MADASPTSAHDDRDAGANKRRRIALACSTCRTRKSKCDGARPRCSACVALDFDCSYVQSSSSANVIVGKEYLSSLEARVSRVEERLGAVESGCSPVRRPHPASFSTVASEVPHYPRDSASPVLSQPPAVDEQEGHTDAIGALNFAEEEDFAFLGPSSNIAFSRHLRPALARLSRCAISGDPAGGSLLRSSRPPSPSSDQHGFERVSPQSDELRLIDDFFSNTALIFPFIHERSFRQRYHEMKTDQSKPVQKSWLALFNMVLAIAISVSRTDISAVDRQRESDAFYRRALHLSRGQMMRCSSLETVQLLLLMSQYLQGTQKSLQTFIIHGLAVKGAFQLGLHSKEATLHLTPVEREFRKRTWFGIVIVDRTMSMTFGRPASVPDDYVRLNLPVLERLVDPATAQNVTKDMAVSFYNATITLYNIMYTTIKTCYGGNLGCSDSPVHTLDVVTRIYGLEKQLHEWKASLPPGLSLRTSAETPSPNDAETVLNRARTILALRFLNLRILVNRPIVVDLLDAVGRPEDSTQPQHSLVRQVGTNNLATCISSAIEIIAIVSNTVRLSSSNNNVSSGQHKRLLGAWWFTLYYTFNAALVLCAALVVRLDYRDGFAGDNGTPCSPSSSEMRASFDTAIDALALLDRRNKTIDRCAQHLRGLGAALDSFIASRERGAHPLASAFPRPSTRSLPARGLALPAFPPQSRASERAATICMDAVVGEAESAR
ncbi:fungal-specific transcription factor domain-containing protein [Phyllosticta citriasiana]|uniref:Fungal-specific transcription factor domain-containing protein n=1 Tax=Phyllosticta citriasiana TaxID=595635 RepID=A0ABR1KB53_9PEZI